MNVVIRPLAPDDDLEALTALLHRRCCVGLTRTWRRWA
jgi:hypothetical protein